MAKTAKQQIRVLLADDHAIFRDGLRKLLDSDEDITIVGEAQNGAECIKLLAKLKPDILLLDLRMPDKDGLAVLEEVNFDTLPTRVVVLTAAEDDRDVVRAMRLGARGVVLKQSATDLLVKSIHRVHAGEIWLDNRMTAEVMKAFSKSSEAAQKSQAWLKHVPPITSWLANASRCGKHLPDRRSVAPRFRPVFFRRRKRELSSRDLVIPTRALPLSFRPQLRAGYRR